MSKDLKKLTDTELKKTLDEKRKALLDMRFNMTGSAKRNSKNTSNSKKEIARIMTEETLRNNHLDTARDKQK